MDPKSRMSAAREVEGWFVRRGVPNFISDYHASTDVFTRAAPFLVFVFLFETLTALDEDRRGWNEVLPVVAAIVVVLGAAAAVNRLRGRRAFQLPDRVGWPELSVFVLVPPLIPVLFGGDTFLESIGLVVTNLIILALVYGVVAFGLIPMTRWAVGQMLRQFGNLLNLMVRALPLLLVLTTFLFLNAELWQVAADFTADYYRLTIGLLLGVTLLFLFIRLPRELDDIERFESWPQVRRLAAGGPAVVRSLGEDWTEAAGLRTPLVRRERWNLVLVLVFSQLVQIVLVSVIIGAFYFVFGLVAVREETIVQWTQLMPGELESDILWSSSSGPNRVIITRTLIRVVGFLAAFSGLQFTVSTLTDDSWRSEFVTDVIGEVREAVAVRALYLRGIVGPVGAGTVVRPSAR
jgi:hypothetical protein